MNNRFQKLERKINLKKSSFSRENKLEMVTTKYDLDQPSTQMYGGMELINSPIQK
jgi:hypothetical protein